MSFQKTFIGFALVGLFAFAIISFGVGMANDNNSNDSILDDSSINKMNSTLGSSLSGFRSLSQGQRENFESEIPTSGFGVLIIFAIISAGKVFTGMVLGIWNILLLPFKSAIGISPIVLGVFSSILVIVIILGAWRLYKAGE